MPADIDGGRHRIRDSVEDSDGETGQRVAEKYRKRTWYWKVPAGREASAGI